MLLKTVRLNYILHSWILKTKMSQNKARQTFKNKKCRFLDSLPPPLSQIVTLFSIQRLIYLSLNILDVLLIWFRAAGKDLRGWNFACRLAVLPGQALGGQGPPSLTPTLRHKKKINYLYYSFTISCSLHLGNSLCTLGQLRYFSVSHKLNFTNI